ncbi:hypothetical protein Trco_003217 [Trichoderma cornu-damae]|uniref:Uncharacterized protein n=1 Tax=Trichoderma cornu-damae TaxID=654480 RepID=A0A9P8QRF6_9HYPO|nr:hypothetical protein Trco_003217 [Trichoderma cornu-damae]
MSNDRNLGLDALGAQLQHRSEELHRLAQRVRRRRQRQAQRVFVLLLRIACLAAAALVGVLLGMPLRLLSLEALLLLSGLLRRLLLLEGILGIGPVGSVGWWLVRQLEVQVHGVEGHPRIDRVVAEVVLPADHVDVGPDLPLSERKVVEVELVVLPNFKDVVQSVEALQGEADVALSSVRNGAADSLCPCKQANGLEGLIVVAVSQLVLGALAVDVPILQVELPRLVHRLCGFLDVALMLGYPGLGHVEVDTLGILFNGTINVLLGFCQVAAHVVVVVLSQVVKRGGLSFVFAFGIDVLRRQVVFGNLSQRILLEGIGVKMLQVCKKRRDALGQHERQIGFCSLTELIACMYEKIERDASSNVTAGELGGVLVVNGLSRRHVVGGQFQGLLQLLVVVNVLRVAVDEEPVSLDGILFPPQLEEVACPAFHRRKAVQVMLCGAVEVV